MTDTFFGMKIYATFTSRCTFVTYTSVSSSRWCNTNRELWAIFSLYSYTRTTTRVKVLTTNTFRSVVYDAILLLGSALPMPKIQFTKFEEPSVKVSYNCVQEQTRYTNCWVLDEKRTLCIILCIKSLHATHTTQTVNHNHKITRKKGGICSDFHEIWCVFL